MSEFIARSKRNAIKCSDALWKGLDVQFFHREGKKGRYRSIPMSEANHYSMVAIIKKGDLTSNDEIIRAPAAWCYFTDFRKEYKV